MDSTQANSINPKTFFMGLGFLAVILKEDVAQHNQAERAIVIAKLIEDFCAGALPMPADLPAHDDKAAPKQLLNKYIEELRETGSAELDHDRTTLLGIYEILLAQKIRRDQKEFFATGAENLIADRILQLATEHMDLG